MHEISPIRVGLKLCAELLHTLLKGVVKVVPVHITDRDQPAALVTYEVKATHSDSARTDNSACQLITRRDIFLVAAHGAEHITWQDREQRQSRRRFLQKASSGFTHSAIVIKLFPLTQIYIFFQPYNIKGHSFFAKIPSMISFLQNRVACIFSQ